MTRISVKQSRGIYASVRNAAWQFADNFYRGRNFPGSWREY